MAKKKGLVIKEELGFTKDLQTKMKEGKASGKKKTKPKKD